MKIVTGSLRGSALEVSKGVRPTGGRTKEALLSRWQESIPGSSFLDLFAGSGAVGLEAASRGACEVVFVERDAGALRTITRNCRVLAPARARVERSSLPGLPAAVCALAPFDHVFADPPYDFQAYLELLESIATVLAKNGEAAIEHARRLSLAPVAGGLVLNDTRDYGESRLSFYGFDQAQQGSS